MENPPKDFFRLAVGREVRLRHAYVIKCTQAIKDPEGNVIELRCTYDPSTRGGSAPAGRKIEGTIQWVSHAHALDAEVRIYDRLFSTEHPGESGDFKRELNPHSLLVVRAKIEPSLASAKPGDRFQFERAGFFIVDADSKPQTLVFNRTVALKDSWIKYTKKVEPKPLQNVEKSKGDPQARSAAVLSAEAQALQAKHGLSADEARTLADEPMLLSLFEHAVRAGSLAKSASALCCNDVLGELRSRKLECAPFDGSKIAELLSLLADGTLSSKQGKDVLGEMFAGESPKAIVEARGFRQISDTGAIEAMVDRVLSGNSDAVQRFKAGNANVLGALVGLVMKESAGKANPKLVNELLRKKLL